MIYHAIHPPKLLPEFNWNVFGHKLESLWHRFDINREVDVKS